MNNRIILLTFLLCGFFSSCTENEDVFMMDEYSIVYPNGTEALIKGIIHTLRWNAPLSSTVTLELYNGSEFIYTIKESLPNTGSYEWDIPTSIPEDSTYKIRIVDPLNSGLASYSIGSFIHAI